MLGVARCIKGDVRGACTLIRQGSIALDHGVVLFNGGSQEGYLGKVRQAPWPREGFQEGTCRGETSVTQSL